MSDTIEPMTGAQRSISTHSQKHVSGATGETIGAFLTGGDQQRLAVDLVGQAKAAGADLVGPDGLMAQLTKRVLEVALEAEMVEHLGYEAHDPEGRNGRNLRIRKRSKTVLTGVGAVEIDVPRGREGSFEPVIVKKRQRRLDSIDQIVLPLTAKGLTTGEISAHFAEIYGASVGKDQVSRITDAVIAEMTDWQNRPLDRGRSLTVVANHGIKPVAGQCVMTSLGVRSSRTRRGRLLSCRPTRVSSLALAHFM